MKGIHFMDKTFDTQKSFTEYVNDKLKLMCGDVKEGSIDFLFLHELYKRHPYYTHAIDYFHVMPLAQGGEELNRVYNGVYDKFSKHSCIKGKMRTEQHYMKALARELVNDQVKSIRKILGDKCELCSSTERLEVDHYPVLFSKILEDYGHLTTSFNLEKNKYETTDEVTKSWKLYHHTHAKYRVLCSCCNKKTYWDKTI